MPLFFGLCCGVCIPRSRYIYMSIYMWVDERSNFHMLHHAYYGGTTDYPLPGITNGVCNDAPLGCKGCTARMCAHCRSFQPK